MTTPRDRVAAECEAQGVPLVVTDELVLRRTAAAIRHSAAATAASSGAPLGSAESTATPSPDVGSRIAHVAPSAATHEHGSASADPTSESDEPAGANRRAV